MDEIITSGSIATASHPEFDVQDETMDTAGDIDDELDDAEEEEGEEDVVGVEPMLKKKGGNRKRMANAKPTEPRVKWMSKEYECLDEAWKTVSIDPITGVNQNTDTYCGRIKTVLDERKLVDPDFDNIRMDRGEKAMSNHWSTIQTTCNKWHGIVKEVAARSESGANVEGQMVRMFAMYRADNEDQEFKFLHVFSRIESCEKWREFRLALDKAKETYNPDTPAPPTAEAAQMEPKKPGRRGMRRPLPNDCKHASPTQEQRCEEGGEIRCAVVGVDGEPTCQARPFEDQRRREEEEHQPVVLEGMILCGARPDLKPYAGAGNDGDDNDPDKNHSDDPDRNHAADQPDKPPTSPTTPASPATEEPHCAELARLILSCTILSF
ncbi:putative methionyl-tRNA synthetase [Hordeum vulgare]|nr:putative methionyl-tRNA synthetase [Hordeum vulgare]